MNHSSLVEVRPLGPMPPPPPPPLLLRLPCLPSSQARAAPPASTPLQLSKPPSQTPSLRNPLFKHTKHKQSDVAYAYFRDRFELATGSAYAPGQQAFISYGAQTNTSLLQYYGAARERGG